MKNFDNQLSRMKAMMNYGLQTENKNIYSSIEYQKEGADGKMYGIVREGTKYYVKVANNKKSNLVKEDFDYIGGFRNRKHSEYSSYANALKNFEMKMSSLRESTGNRNVIIETWNPDLKEELMVEATERMRKEIARQRQIMGNAAIINECGSKKSCCASAPFCDAASAEDLENVDKMEDNNISTKSTPIVGKGAKGEVKNSSTEQKQVKEAAEPLAWHEDGGDAHKTMNDTYLDTSKGTEIGDSAPFDKTPSASEKSEEKNGVVEESESMAMDCGDNQNAPKPGVGEVGDDAPFDDKAKNGLQEDFDDFEGDDVEDDAALEDDMADDVDFEAEDDFEGEEMSDDFDSSLDDMEAENEEAADVEGDMEARMTAMEDLLSKIAEKLGVNAFEDDTLYDDDELDADAEGEEMGAEDDVDMGFGADEDFGGEDDFADDTEDEEVFESRSYRNMKKMNEDRLDYFGKHPSYRKRVMTLPKNGEDKNEHGEDWNDESVHGEQPFGQKIGSSAPFEVDPATIENAIAESIKRVLGKRK